MSVAATYAEALFEAAEAQGAIDLVRSQLGEFVTAMADTPDLRAVLASPEVEASAKRAAVSEIMEGAHPVTTGMVQVLLDRGRIGEVDAVVVAYGRRVDVAEGRVVVTAVTAVSLTPELREAIRAKVRTQTGRDVELDEAVDPSIIGGLVLRVGDVVVDASVRTRLDEMRRSLENAHVDSAAAIQA